jgi:lysophospholipase L1-like esterase
MRRSKIILLAGVLLCAVAGWFFYMRNPAIANAPPRRGAIVALGDSLTAGMGAAAGETYPDYLARMIGRPVVNCGVSGETIAEATARIDRDVLALRPAIVIVLLGGNDLLRRLDLNESFKLLEADVRRLQRTGAMVALVGINDMPLVGIQRRYRQVARRTGALYVPNILHGIYFNQKLMSDKIHPNSAGYKIMAERIATALRPYL